MLLLNRWLLGLRSSNFLSELLEPRRLMAQVVWLDFSGPSFQSRLDFNNTAYFAQDRLEAWGDNAGAPIRLAGTWTADEVASLRNGIQAFVVAAYEQFDMVFTQVQPASGSFTRVDFSKSLENHAGECNIATIRNDEEETCAIDVFHVGNGYSAMVGRLSAISDLARRIGIVVVHELGHSFSLFHLDSFGDPLFTNAQSVPDPHRHYMMDSYAGSGSFRTISASFSALELAKMRHGQRLNASPLLPLDVSATPNSSFDTAVAMGLGEAHTFDRTVGAFVQTLYDTVGDNYYTFNTQVGDILTVNPLGSGDTTTNYSVLPRADVRLLKADRSVLPWPQPNVLAVSSTDFKRENPSSLEINTNDTGLVLLANYLVNLGDAGATYIRSISSSLASAPSLYVLATLHRFNMVSSMAAAGGGTDVIITGTTGSDTISVTASGGSLNITINGVVRTNSAPSGNGKLYIYGYAGDDSILLSGNVNSNAVIDGAEGDDYLIGGFGSDVLWGGSGNDVLIGDPTSSGTGGADTLHGGHGSDTLEGRSGSDILDGATGDDVYFFWNASNDLGSDTITESLDSGSDTLDFQGFSRRVKVDLGATASNAVIDNVSDWYFGQSSRLRLNFAANTIENVIGSNSVGSQNAGDQLFGSSQSNLLDGRGGDDLLVGKAGNDVYSFGATAGNFDLGADTIVENSAEGVDTIDFSGFSRRVFVNLGNVLSASAMDNFGIAGWYTTGESYLNLTSTATVGGAAIANVIENVVGSNVTQNGVLGAISDVIFGSAIANRIDGQGGYDIIYGLGGNDTLLGADGNDTIFGYGGNDIILGGRGADTLYGGDSVATASGNDRILGGEGDDSIFGEDGNDGLYGEDNVDSISNPSTGNDTIRGGDGIDFIYGGKGADMLYGDAGDDEIYAAYLFFALNDNSIDHLFGGQGNDNFLSSIADGDVVTPD